jgi:hypothetical protein
MGNERQTGGCACGAVRYTVLGDLRPVWNCHCDRCRRITGHFMAATAARHDDLRLDADDTLRWYHPDDDPTVGYGFCSRCGATLFWQSAAGDGARQMSIAAGTLDPPTGLQTEGTIFGDEASDYHDLDPSIPTLPGDHTIEGS